jgi:hypothetical protein
MLLGSIREKFQKGDYSGALQNFRDLGDLKTIRSGIRIEAIALAARSNLALGSKRDAMKLLKSVGERPLKHHRLYRHLALACLELGDYRRAAEFAISAAELVEDARSEADS